MDVRVWIVMLMVTPVTLFRRPAELSLCHVFQKDADCSHLNLRNIPKHLPSGIHTLDLSQNRLQNLTDDSLLSYTAIHHLKLHANQIQFIQPGVFRDMSHLHVLDLSRNSLDVYGALKTHVGPLPSVHSLDLSGNGLFTHMSDYFLRDAPVLTNLSLNGNSITKISRDTFNGSQALRNIDLHNNVIIEIEEGAFESLSDLSELDLSVNSVSCIVDFNLFQLKTLNLSRNSMSSFQTIDSDRDFELLDLDLRENKILDFPVLPRNNRLVFLDLSRNLLRSVNCSGPVDELENPKDSSFCGGKRHQDLPSLMYLDLSYNQLKSLPSAFFGSTKALETLNVSNNCLQSFRVTADGQLNSLRTLDISFNKLQDLELEEETLKALEVLHLQGNSLRVLDANIFSRLPSIQSLHLQQNRLSICPAADGCVSLAGNELRTLAVDFTLFSNLKSLDLSMNRLTALSLKDSRNTELSLISTRWQRGSQCHQLRRVGFEMKFVGLKRKKLRVSVCLLRVSVRVSVLCVCVSALRVSVRISHKSDFFVGNSNIQMKVLSTWPLNSLHSGSDKRLVLVWLLCSCMSSLTSVWTVHTIWIVLSHIINVFCKERGQNPQKDVNIPNPCPCYLSTLETAAVRISRPLNMLFVFVYFFITVRGFLSDHQTHSNSQTA
ncbi:hypothetical protein E1301_Tti023579 [Triplophysa tibetana]|uniref:Leucine-rich repeat-containing protein 32 n=1 Tax=Triplophysa tibetana TaxID=1572043 RepID=A0A5A9N5V5_9TELE|nr:hypothetical protein E1301_Tti023579 [Triplophysa tibetana]